MGLDVPYDHVSIGVDVQVSGILIVLNKLVAKERDPAQQRSPEESSSVVTEKQ